MNFTLEILDPAYGGVSEGPVWDGSGLLYTRIQQCRIMRFDPASGRCAVWREGTGYANGLALDSRGRLHACEGGATPDGRRLVRYEADGSVTVLADRYNGKRLNIPNDLVIDPQGRIWFTDPFYEGAAGPWSADTAHKELDHDSVYRLDPSAGGGYEITRVTFDTTRPNGLAFSPDGRVLYVAQSGRRPEETRQLRAYPVLSDMTLGTPRVLHDFGEHRGIDGMCVDPEGRVFATAGYEKGGPGPMVYVFSPGGRVLEMISLPCRRPTNCAFGPDPCTLYITSIEGFLFRGQRLSSP
jgi:gluconolactonase